MSSKMIFEKVSLDHMDGLEVERKKAMVLFMNVHASLQTQLIVRPTTDVVMTFSRTNGMIQIEI